MKRRPRQLTIESKYKGRGGPRKGAGRPRKPGGRLFAERYHAHVLKTPREVRHAIDYVLANWFRHAGREVGPYDLDRLSSIANGSTVVPPQTWLLRVGWEAG